MSSKDAITKLAGLFNFIGEKENKIESVKNELYKLDKFSPQELFKILDEETKGYISLNNLSNLLGDLEYDPIFLRHLIHCFDKNNDFCWDYNEYCNFIGVNFDEYPLNNSEENQDGQFQVDPQILLAVREIVLEEIYLVKELGEKVNEIKNCNNFTVYDCFNAIDTNKNNVIHTDNLSNFLKRYKYETDYVPKIIWRLNPEGGDILNYDNFEKIFVPFALIENQEYENNMNGDRSEKNNLNSDKNNNSNDIQIDDEFSNNNKSNNNIDVDEVVSADKEMSENFSDKHKMKNDEYKTKDPKSMNYKNENNTQTFTHFKYGSNTNEEEQLNSYKQNIKINDTKEVIEKKSSNNEENKKDILSNTKKYLGLSTNNDNFYSHNSYNSIHSHSLNNKSLYEGNFESPKNRVNVNNSTFTSNSYYDYKNPLNLNLNNDYTKTKKSEPLRVENLSKYDIKDRYIPFINYKKTNESFGNNQSYNTYISPSRYNVTSNNFEKRISSPPRNNYRDKLTSIKPTNEFDRLDNTFKPLLSETLYKTTRSPRYLSPYRRTQRISPYRYRFEDSLRLTSPYRISTFTYRSPYRQNEYLSNSRSPKKINLNTTISSSNFAYFLARVSIFIIKGFRY